MRKIILITTLVFFFIAGFSQDINSVGMKDEFKTIAGFGKRQTGFEGIQTYTNHAVTGTQFFTETWANGSVTSIINQTISEGFVFLYDKVRQELFFKPKDSDIVLLAIKGQIRSFVINSDKPHTFFPAENYDPALKNNFIELIVPGGNYQLLKITRTTFEKANTNDMEKIKQGDFSDKFVDHVTYYIYHNKQLKKIPSLTEHGLRKALKDESKKLDSFFESHQNSELNEDLLTMLFNSLNS